MVSASLLKTQGAFLEATIQVGELELRVMDEFSPDDDRAYQTGQLLNVEFVAQLDDDEDESWEVMFSGNPAGRIGLEHLGGWRYRAFGRVVSVSPVVTDCGLLLIDGPVESNDPALVGEFVAFTIARLGACGNAA